MFTNSKSCTSRLSLLLMLLLSISCDHSVEPGETGTADFFPLKVGNQWTYTFSTYWNSQGYNMHWCKGTDTWKIVSSTPRGLDMIYTILETINAVDTAYSSEAGTHPVWTITQYPNANWTFTVTDSANAGLAFTFFPDSLKGDSPNYWLTYLLPPLKMSRYKTADSSVYTYYRDDGYRYIASFAKSVGLKVAHLGFGGGMTQTYCDLLLSDYQLK